MLFNSDGEENENMVNQQVGEVSIPHFGDGNLEAQVKYQMFCLGALKILKALKVQIDLKFVRGFWFFFLPSETNPLERANYKNKFKDKIWCS